VNSGYGYSTVRYGNLTVDQWSSAWNDSLANRESLIKFWNVIMYADSSTLTSLFLMLQATNGSHWNNSSSWLDSETHHCFWYGVDCVHTDSTNFNVSSL